jgi:opacity protein-like surface antigen
MKLFSPIMVFFVLILLTSSMMSQSFGIRGGIGTDITGGIAYGGSINYQFPAGNNWLEVGPIFYIGHFEETTEEFHTYEETTDLTVFGVMANYLINYPTESGVFFVVGAGFAAVSVEWEETSETDVSLGTPLPGGGSKQSEDGTAGGTVLNVGAGYKFSGNVDARAEIPVIIIAGAPGEASAVAPTFTITVGFRFQ